VKKDGAMPSIQGGAVEVVQEEPLKRELVDFIDAVRTGRAPTVSGQDGRRALELATRIVEKMSLSYV
jgi:predicted dehydrogenase